MQGHVRCSCVYVTSVQALPRRVPVGIPSHLQVLQRSLEQTGKRTVRVAIDEVAHSPRRQVGRLSSALQLAVLLRYVLREVLFATVWLLSAEQSTECMSAASSLEADQRNSMLYETSGPCRMLIPVELCLPCMQNSVALLHALQLHVLHHPAGRS
jgi:hypothetical protein